MGTETIYLNQFDDIRLSEDGVFGQFELINFEKDIKRVFIADSMKELDEWYNGFKLRMHTKKHDDIRYDYWSNESNPKYYSMKEEVTKNRLYSISIAAFDAALNKARHLINNSAKIRNMTVCSEVLETYNLCYDSPIQIDHI